MDIFCLNIEDAAAEDYHRLYRLASPERQDRADRCRRFADALRCVAGEALLRLALGGGERIEVASGSNGKPFVKNRADFHFNLSHAGSWVVLAAANSEIGVDVEKITADEGKLKIADRYFTARERDFIFSETESGTRAERFAAIWTGKESYLKYLGTGLTKRLDSFAVIGCAVEDPVGRINDAVRIRRIALDERHCLSLCSGEPEYSLRKLTVQQLLNELKRNEPPA